MQRLALKEILRSSCIDSLRAGDTANDVFVALGDPGYRGKFYSYGDLEFALTDETINAKIINIHIYPGRTSSSRVDCDNALTIDHPGFTPRMPFGAFLTWLMLNELPFSFEPSHGNTATSKRVAITNDTRAFFDLVDTEFLLSSIMVSYVPDMKAAAT